jgi:hypothetical protein
VSGRYLRPVGGRGDYFDHPHDPLLAGQALDRDDLAEQTEAVRRAREQLTVAEWQKASMRIHAALEHFEGAGRPGPALQRGLRAVERTTIALDRQLGA